MIDIKDKPITVTVQTAVIVIVFIVGVVSAASFGYFRLNATANLGLGKATEAVEALDVVKCELAELKLFMLHGIKPDPTDNCSAANHRSS